MSKSNIEISSVVLSSSTDAGKGISKFLSRTFPILGSLNFENNKESSSMLDYDNTLDLYVGTCSTDIIDNDQNEARTDVLGDLPNWANMSLEDILPKVAYHKRTGKNGVSTLKPLEKENLFTGKNDIIPVKNASDGSEMGRNEWSGDDPETVIIKAMARDEAYLINWGFDLNTIQPLVEKMVACTDSSHTHPIKDAEDLIEYMLQKRQEKYTTRINALKKWLVTTFGRIDAQRIWNTIRVQVDVEVSINQKEEGFDFDRACTSTFWLTRTGEKNEQGKWIKFDSPMSLIVEELANKFGHGTRLEKSGWKIVSTGINARFWGSLTGALDLKPLSGALEGTIKRWCVSKIREEALKVWAENNHVDRQIADIGAKTPWFDRFRPEESDYAWWNRE